MNLRYEESLPANYFCDGGIPDPKVKTEEETANKDNEILFEELVIKDQDPVTGKMFEKTLTNVTRAQSKDLMLKGARLESKSGAMNALILKEARNIAKEMVGTQYDTMQKFIKDKERDKEEEEALEPPTAEEMEKDPKALPDYLKKRDAILLGRVKKTLSDADKDRLDEGELFENYNAEIGRAVKAFPLTPRKVLVDLIKGNDIPVENVFAYAQALNEEFVANLNLDDVPEEQRDKKIKAYVLKNKAPKPPRTGPSKPEDKKKFKDLDEMLESHLKDLEAEENL